jgi:hypothetical protein
MRPSTKIPGLGATAGATVAACAACCAVPVLGSALAVVGLAGLGTAAAGWAVGLVVLLLAVAVGLVVFRRRAAASACAASARPTCTPGACGCGSMPTSTS